MFASNERGADAWATLITLAQSAVLNNLDPTNYLNYILDVYGSHKHKGDVETFDKTPLLPWIVDSKLINTNAKE